MGPSWGPQSCAVVFKQIQKVVKQVLRYITLHYITVLQTITFNLNILAFTLNRFQTTNFSLLLLLSNRC